MTQSPDIHLSNHSKTNHWQYLKELATARQIAYLLARRELSLRYREATLGVFWAIIRPLLTMGIIVLVFSRIGNVGDKQTNYPLFVLLPALFWQLFTGSINQGATCLVANSTLLTKVYFPRMLLPAVPSIVHFVDFSISLLVFLGLLLSSSVPLSPALFLLVPIAVQCVALSISANLLLSAVCVYFRDFNFIIPILVQFGILACPIGYSSAVVPAKWQLLYSLNPLVGIFEAARWTLWGSDYPLLLEAIGLSLGTTAALAVGGYFVFRRVETELTDII